MFNEHQLLGGPRQPALAHCIKQQPVGNIHIHVASGHVAPKNAIKTNPTAVSASKHVTFKLDATLGMQRPDKERLPKAHAPPHEVFHSQLSATMVVDQLDSELRGGIRDMRLLKESMASLKHNQAKADVYMELLLLAQGISLQQAQARIEVGKQLQHDWQQQRGIMSPAMAAAAQAMDVSSSKHYINDQSLPHRKCCPLDPRTPSKTLAADESAQSPVDRDPTPQDRAC